MASLYVGTAHVTCKARPLTPRAPDEGNIEPVDAEAEDPARSPAGASPVGGNATRDGGGTSAFPLFVRLQLEHPLVVFGDHAPRCTPAQQDAVLPPVEAGLFTFIGATTETPSF